MGTGAAVNATCSVGSAAVGRASAVGGAVVSRVEPVVTSVGGAVVSRAQPYAETGLNKAQPYVQNVVSTATPYVQSAVTKAAANQRIQSVYQSGLVQRTIGFAEPWVTPVVQNPRVQTVAQSVATYAMPAAAETEAAPTATTPTAAATEAVAATAPADAMPLPSPAKDECGQYAVVTNALVSKTATLPTSPGGQKAGEVLVGETVNVLEIVEMPDINRVRARIEAPEGWVSVRGLGEDCQRRWLEKQADVAPVVGG